MLKVLKIKRISSSRVNQSQIRTSMAVMKIWLPGVTQLVFITKVLLESIMLKIKAKVIMKEKRHRIMRKLEIGDNSSTRKS